MNIEKYRAIMAKEKEEKDNGGIQDEQPIIVVDGEKPSNTKVENKTEEPKVEEGKVEEPKSSEIEFVEIDGEKVSIDELKNGYLRQSDYTKKTQSVAREKKELEDAVKLYETLKQNPNIVEGIKQNNLASVPQGLDPTEARIVELQNAIYDMKLEQEIKELQNKYEDFEVREVLTLANEKGITNLEDAYLLSRPKNTNKPTEVDIDKLKEELKQELLKEINANNTDTIISSSTGSNAPKNKEVHISKAEVQVAQGMGLSVDEYIKWRDS